MATPFFQGYYVSTKQASKSDKHKAVISEPHNGIQAISCKLLISGSTCTGRDLRHAVTGVVTRRSNNMKRNAAHKSPLKMQHQKFICCNVGAASADSVCVNVRRERRSLHWADIVFRSTIGKNVENNIQIAVGLINE